MKTPYSRETVAVIGAGVIGLSSALRIQSLLAQRPETRHVELLLVAREWPTSIPGAPPQHSADYASMWAGAHVRPIPASTPQLKREAQWLKQTVRTFEEQLDTEPWVGITRTPGVEFLDTPSTAYQEQTKESFEEETGLFGYRRLGASELPEGAEIGFEYPTYCVNSPVYCANLLRKFIARGGKTLHRELKSEWEAFILRSNVKLVINASGTGFNDTKYFPTRGQTVVTNLTTATKTVTRQHKDGSWSFIIPRFFDGGTIVGGTKDLGSWQTEPNENTRQRLLQGGQALTRYACPPSSETNKPLAVIADVVGRRPTREGGMRLQMEEKQLTGTDGELRTGHIVHAYGAGGRGYEISWGVANDVTELVDGLLPGLISTKAKL